MDEPSTSRGADVVGGLVRGIFGARGLDERSGSDVSTAAWEEDGRGLLPEDRVRVAWRLGNCFEAPARRGMPDRVVWLWLGAGREARLPAAISLGPVLGAGIGTEG